ncbi:MAG: hypothetical protein L3J75_04645 [Methylococcaceae bacterium]|nr:hypothetical protein [Methylococcaceae bacterium]
MSQLIIQGLITVLENLSSNTEHRGGSARNSDEVSVVEMAQKLQFLY